MSGRKLKLIMVCLNGSKLRGYFSTWHATENLVTMKSVGGLSLNFEVVIPLGWVIFLLGWLVMVFGGRGEGVGGFFSPPVSWKKYQSAM